MFLAMKTRNQWLVRFDPSIVAVKQSSIVSQIGRVEEAWFSKYM